MEHTKEDQCSVTVFGGRGWNYPCQKKAVAEREGKSYCKIHDPEYIKEKMRRWNEKFKEKSAKDDLRYARLDAIEQACNGLTTEELLSLTPSRLRASNAMYEALKVVESDGTVMKSTRIAIAYILAKVEGK